MMIISADHDDQQMIYNSANQVTFHPRWADSGGTHQMLMKMMRTPIRMMIVRILMMMIKIYKLSFKLKPYLTGLDPGHGSISKELDSAVKNF